MNPSPALVETLAGALLERHLRLATAESCTGGLVAAACTERSGSSAWFDRGFVTYSNEAKTEMLGVDARLIAQHGAVSEPVACAMAKGALQHSQAHIALAITGVAGPNGGSVDKPVGTVWFAYAVTQAQRGFVVSSDQQQFAGTRAEIRAQAVAHALHTAWVKLQA